MLLTVFTCGIKHHLLLVNRDINFFMWVEHKVCLVPTYVCIVHVSFLSLTFYLWLEKVQFTGACLWFNT